MSKKMKKSAKNNQWATTSQVGMSQDHVEKTEFSNEWASTNKMSDEKACDCECDDSTCGCK